MSSATRHALREVLTWGAVALGAFALIYYLDDLRAALVPTSRAHRAMPRSHRSQMSQKPAAGSTALRG
jgi:hypothetical protein